MFHRHGFRFGERFFHKGDFKYLILDLLKEKPRYGYEVIRALEERFHGFYAPSPGIVYPTLQMLEEMGYVTAAAQEGKRVYTITEAGRQSLAEHERAREEALDQMEKRWDPGLHHKLRHTVRELWEIWKLIGSRARDVDAAKLDKVQETLARTRKEVEEILSQQ